MSRGSGVSETRAIGNQGTKPTSYPLAASGFEGPKMAGLSSGLVYRGACIREACVLLCPAPPQPSQFFLAAQPQSYSSRVWPCGLAGSACVELLLGCGYCLVHSHALAPVPRLRSAHLGVILIWRWWSLKQMKTCKCECTAKQE